MKFATDCSKAKALKYVIENVRVNHVIDERSVSYAIKL